MEIKSKLHRHHRHHRHLLHHHRRRHPLSDTTPRTQPARSHTCKSASQPRIRRHNALLLTYLHPLPTLPPPRVPRNLQHAARRAMRKGLSVCPRPPRGKPPSANATSSSAAAARRTRPSTSRPQLSSAQLPRRRRTRSSSSDGLVAVPSRRENNLTGALKNRRGTLVICEDACARADVSRRDANGRSAQRLWSVWLSSARPHRQLWQCNQAHGNAGVATNKPSSIPRLRTVGGFRRQSNAIYRFRGS